MIDRAKLGELMHHWHDGASDPIYAVGSYYVAGKPYPGACVAADALKSIKSYTTVAEPGTFGWTEADVRELQTIAEGLEHYLRLDYPEGGRP